MASPIIKGLFRPNHLPTLRSCHRRRPTAGPGQRSITVRGSHMRIRTYQPGDEQPQALIYNAAAVSLPAFKPASADEIARRYERDDTDPGSRFYAVLDDEVV